MLSLRSEMQACSDGWMLARRRMSSIESDIVGYALSVRDECLGHGPPGTSMLNSAIGRLLS